jgi:hypothetical protein
LAKITPRGTGLQGIFDYLYFKRNCQLYLRMNVWYKIRRVMSWEPQVYPPLEGLPVGLYISPYDVEVDGLVKSPKRTFYSVIKVSAKELGMKKESQEGGWIRRIPLQVTPPSLKDNTADVDRLVKAIKKALDVQDVAIDFVLAKKIPSLLREHQYAVQAVLYHGDRSWHLIGI